MDGYVVHLDMTSVVELVKLLRSISNNVNQIARRCNETRNLYAQDVEYSFYSALYWYVYYHGLH